MWGEAAVYINASVIEVRVLGARMPWNIVDQWSHKGHEFFRGQSDLGSIKVIITKKGFSIANGRKVFFIGCKV